MAFSKSGSTLYLNALKVLQNIFCVLCTELRVCAEPLFLEETVVLQEVLVVRLDRGHVLVHLNCSLPRSTTIFLMWNSLCFVVQSFQLCVGHLSWFLVRILALYSWFKNLAYILQYSVRILALYFFRSPTVWSLPISLKLRLSDL